MTILSRGRRVGLSALTATALVLGAAACGSTSSSGGGTQSASTSAGASAPASTATSSAAAAGATSTAAATSSAASAGGSVAAPGATFKAGQTATVGFDTTTKAGKPGPSYKINVNVASITKGSLADFNGIKLDANEKASTPYYVKVKITSLGPGKMTTTATIPRSRWRESIARGRRSRASPSSAISPSATRPRRRIRWLSARALRRA